MHKGFLSAIFSFYVIKESTDALCSAHHVEHEDRYGIVLIMSKLWTAFSLSLLHSDVANVFHFSGTYLECRLNRALSFITPTPDLSSNYKKKEWTFGRWTILVLMLRLFKLF